MRADRMIIDYLGPAESFFLPKSAKTKRIVGVIRRNLRPSLLADLLSTRENLCLHKRLRNNIASHPYKLTLYAIITARNAMKNGLLFLAVLTLYVLHQDFWLWRKSMPFVFGFIPQGLFYHACYSVAAALVLWLLVKHAWPGHLDEED